jgi:hypothetical protein
MSRLWPFLSHHSTSVYIIELDFPKKSSENEIDSVALRPYVPFLPHFSQTDYFLIHQHQGVESELGKSVTWVLN